MVMVILSIRVAVLEAPEVPVPQDLVVWMEIFLDRVDLQELAEHLLPE